MSGAVNAVSSGSGEGLDESFTPAVLREPFPVVRGTSEGDEAFKEVALKCRTSNRYRYQLVPEVKGDPFLGAVENSGGKLGSPRYQLLGNNTMRALMSCAIYAWKPTDEQVVAAFAVAEASGVMDFDLGGSITPSHLAIASLVPGAENSTMVRSLAASLSSLTAGELGNWATLVRQRILGLMGLVLRCHGLIDGDMLILPRAGERLSERIENMMTLNDANFLRRRCLHRVGKQFLGQVGSSSFHGMEVDGGVVREENLLGAQKLLAFFPGESPFTRLSVDNLLPLEFLMALPSFKVERLGEFHALVEEYNLEWALASYDWSGGEGV